MGGRAHPPVALPDHGICISHAFQAEMAGQADVNTYEVSLALLIHLTALLALARTDPLHGTVWARSGSVSFVDSPSHRESPRRSLAGRLPPSEDVSPREVVRSCSQTRGNESASVVSSGSQPTRALCWHGWYLSSLVFPGSEPSAFRLSEVLYSFKRQIEENSRSVLTVALTLYLCPLTSF
jgi:hypothetical protein